MSNYKSSINTLLELRLLLGEGESILLPTLREKGDHVEDLDDLPFAYFNPFSPVKYDYHSTLPWNNLHQRSKGCAAAFS